MIAALVLGAVAWLAPGPFCCPIVSAGTAPPVQTAPGVATALLRQTKFDPKVHGFEFTNYFTGDILVDLPVIGRVDLGNTTYGLCGGMIFAAYDTFNLGAMAPDVPTTPPASGTPMRSYIYGRQMDSLRNNDWFLVRRLVSWIRKPLKDQTVPNPAAKGGVNVLERGLIHLSGKEFKNKIQPELNAGRPVTIALVKASGEDLLSNSKAAFSKNHQVLAIGYRKHGDEWQIDIYDPNFPNTIQTLHTDGRYQTQKGTTTHTGSFRGFYRAPYKIERPPWVKASPTVASRLKSFPAVSLGRPDSDD